nr:uncharacterized protein CTRU02_10680 [Colletotrichum truncatum]KAF6786981.1 hypothetical protein CTRU02_10680 [Colletotrichum truncatum]
MLNKKRRHSGDESPREEDASIQKAVSRADRGHLSTRPSEPGTLADVYYRNLFASKPDFASLGKEDSEFGALLKKHSLDFNDPIAVMQLTKTLLKLKFGLAIELPDDRLCPPVVNRHNYILWLKGLMDSTSYDNPDRKVLGLDIGTGASCIYPLLGCTQRRWSFFATDIDDKSLSYAKRNVELNNLQNRISIVSRQPSDKLIPLEELGVQELGFVMTNPPFYTSEEDMRNSAELKDRPAKAVCTGAPNEMVTEGGEVAFVGRILEESLELRERVQWYTAMFGKHSSMEEFVGMLRKHNIENYAVTELVQGTTRRWALGWSFGGMRPAEDIARGLEAAKWKKLLPPIVESRVVDFPLADGVGKLGDKVQELLSSLELMSWDWDREKLSGVGRAREDVWSRAWRRKKMREAREGKPAAAVSTEDRCNFGFEISLKVGRERVVVTCRWREGHAASIYESFCGFLKTRLSGTQTLSGK